MKGKAFHNKINYLFKEYLKNDSKWNGAMAAFVMDNFDEEELAKFNMMSDKACEELNLLEKKKLGEIDAYDLEAI